MYITRREREREKKKSFQIFQFFKFSMLELKLIKFLMRFFKQKVSLSLSWWLFCTFLVETLYAINKSSTSKCKYSDLPPLVLKFTKFFMTFLLKPRPSFLSNFVSLSSAIRGNSSVLFHLKLYITSTKGTHQM